MAESNNRVAWQAAYRAYLQQWGKPRSPFLNRYNLFYDFNYWDRHWLKKVRKTLAKGIHITVK